MTRIVEALLQFNGLTDMQNCLEFPAGICAHVIILYFGVWIQPYCIAACA